MYPFHSSSTMAHKSITSICFFLLLISLFVLPLLTHAKLSSAFEFIKDLEGCQKGKSAKDLNKLKAYLQRFGYLNYNNLTHAGSDEFDDSLVEAIKTYQLNHRLSATGILDSDTVSKMVIPRCGVPDIIKKGTNYMHPKEHSSGVHTVAHYNFLPTNPRWPRSKTQLTYSFYPNTSSEAQAAVGRAFREWASAVNYFSFSETDDLQSSDLKVGFFSGDHRDGRPFDGPNGTLAHALGPTNGDFHYDADENWVVGAVPNGYDLEMVAIHEIGHLLGLDHSSDPNAAMYPYTPPDSTKGLGEDDIEGLKALYGLQSNTSSDFQVWHAVLSCYDDI